MAQNTEQVLQRSVLRIFRIIKLEGKEISAIYFYAILYGLLMLTLPIGIQSIINFVLAGRFNTSMVILIAGVVLGVFFTGLLQVNQMKLNEKIQQGLFANYAFEFAWRLPRIQMKSVDRYFMPELVNRFFDVVSLQKGLSKLLLDIPVATIQILFGLILLSFYNPVFIIFGILLIFLLYLIIRYTSKQGLLTSLEESDYKYKVAGWLQETARVARSIKFSRNFNLAINRTDENVAGYLVARNSHFRILLLQYWALILFKVIITLAMLVVGGLLLVEQRLNVGQFVAAEIVIITVLNSVEKFIISLDKVYDILTSVEKLGYVIDNPIETEGNLELDASNGVSIRTKNLSFGYYDDRPVINDLTMDIPAGSMVCIAGPEGAGKSTLLRLLTGSFNDFTGQILINDIPIGNYQLQSLRHATGIYISQQEIFEGTLWENIALGSCPYTPQQIMQFADMIGLGDFIGGLRHGFETKLDPMGRRLSKTTVQKILLLRAIAGKPKILLLEEPWEGMDEQSRANIINLLQTEMKGATILIATSEERFKAMADQVIVLSNIDANRS